MSFIFLYLFIFWKGASGTSVSVVNDCDFTVWPGISGDPNLNITGLELKTGDLWSFQAPKDWSGTIWGRTSCTFNRSGHGSCKTGDCGSGELECNGGSATPPVTLAKFTFDSFLEVEYYSVSLAKGYNLQMTVEATGGLRDSTLSCVKAGCIHDLNHQCPKELMLKGGGGCKNACQAFGTPDYCPTAYTELFKSACPRSSIYEFNNSYDGLFVSFGANYTIRFCPPADAFSTINLDRQLNSCDQLVSVLGNFTLGFFDDGRHFGIWYTNDAESQKVWVANPNNPIIYTSGEHALSIDQNTGNLIITDGSRTLMTITNVDAGPNRNMTATLEDDGNFRLINEIGNRVLWQSFDHPTNVLLPGMKLGFNMSTGTNWTLTSWLSNTISYSGAFTLSWELINEPFLKLMIRRRGKPYWSGGNIILQNSEYRFAFYNNSDGPSYYITSVYNEDGQYFSYENSHTALPMWVLTPEGQISIKDGDNSSAWTPEFCYGYDSGDGCVEKSSLPLCRAKNDNFNKQYGDFDTGMTKNETDENSNLSISDCFAECWNNCGCVGFKSLTDDGTGCVFWTGSLSFVVSSRHDATWKYVISSTVKRKEKSVKRIWIPVGVAILLIFLCLGFLRYIEKRKQRREEKKKRRRDAKFLELTTSESFKDVHQLESNGGNGHDVLLFSFASIMAATHDFLADNKLGQGGFGPVYKGVLSDGREIAVKKLSRASGQGLVEFKNELILIAKLQHTNLVRVLGCCIHGEEKMLIYEYMPNKSLDYFLFDENRKTELDWPKRFNIIEGISQGLLYLHKYSRMRVIHRDLKANNILLDESMNPKISDFGMARIFNKNETQAMTNRVVGTYGYMAPEYAMEGTFSIKSDIYSFGVLILEIVSGRRNSSFVHLGRTINLLGYAWELWQQGNALDLEDPSVGSSSDIQQVLRTIHVALLCVQEDAMDRPTTSDMISMLLNDTKSLPAPNKPAFFLGRAESKSTSNEIQPGDCSVNNMTITVAEGR